jgi:hypothetical protein
MCFALLRTANAAPQSSSALVTQLRQGGYVIVIRHASSPLTKPDKSAADPDNTALERQLDDVGRKTSPSFRALQTVKLADLGTPQTAAELDEGEQGMAGGVNAERTAWLKRATIKAPEFGTDTVLVTHTPNITTAFGRDSAGIAAGEAMIFHPDGKGRTTMVGRIKIEEWPDLIKQQRAQ